jgi:hypothetical protein
MARTTLTKTTPLGGYPSLPISANAADVTLTAADVANKNQFKAEAGDILLAQNSDPTNPYTVTLTSASDSHKRTGDVTAYTLQAGDISVFGPFELEGWRQTDGYFYLEANNAAVKFGILKKV